MYLNDIIQHNKAEGRVLYYNEDNELESMDMQVLTSLPPQIVLDKFLLPTDNLESGHELVSRSAINTVLEHFTNEYRTLLCKYRTRMADIEALEREKTILESQSIYHSPMFPVTQKYDFSEGD